MVQIIDIAREWQEKANSIHEKQQGLDKRLDAVDERLEHLRSGSKLNLARKAFNAAVKIPKAEQEREKIIDMKRALHEQLEALSDEAYTLIGKTIVAEHPELMPRSKDAPVTPEDTSLEEQAHRHQHMQRERGVTLDRLEDAIDIMLGDIEKTRTTVGHAIRQEGHDLHSENAALTAMSWTSTNSAITATSQCADRLKDFSRLYSHEKERCKHIGIELDDMMPKLNDLLDSSAVDFIVGMGDPNSNASTITSMANRDRLNKIDTTLKNIAQEMKDTRKEIAVHKRDSGPHKRSGFRGKEGMDAPDGPEKYASAVESMAARHGNFGSFVRKLRQHMTGGGPDGTASQFHKPPAHGHG